METLLPAIKFLIYAAGIYLLAGFSLVVLVVVGLLIVAYLNR